MADRLETAASGRARCRACNVKIEKGTLRFGEEGGAYGGEDGAASAFWFHLACAAKRRPEKFLAVVRDSEAGLGLPDRAALIAEAEPGIAFPRLPRLAGVQRSPSARARCRQCQELIATGVWRIELSSFAETGFFDPLGFIHLSCGAAYFGTPDLAQHLRARLPEIDPTALQETGDGSGQLP